MPRMEWIAWMRSKQADFSGEWIAIRNDVMVDHDKSRIALHERLTAAGLLTGTLFVKMDFL